MRQTLNEKEVLELARLQLRLCKMYDKISEDDVQLNHGNGVASEQISVAIAALENHIAGILTRKAYPFRRSWGVRLLPCLKALRVIRIFGNTFEVALSKHQKQTKTGT